MKNISLKVSFLVLLLGLVDAQPKKNNWDIYSFHINCSVSGRYATTLIASRVANRMNESKEIEFHVRIPKNAFISKFRMFLDGQYYDGAVKAKEEAQQQYTGAVSRGESAGLVRAVGRTLEEFKTSVNVAAHQKVTFELTYEELLKRKHGKYKVQIHAQPMQPVKDFKVDVYIKEKEGINLLQVKGSLSSSGLNDTITKTLADKEASVHFYPTVEQQKTCSGCGGKGLDGDLIVVYDVNRDEPFGEIEVSEGYFVHHFAPSNIPRIPKSVVFVIDQSGSMHGRKIEQTRIALLHILSDLAEEDFFGLISFDSSIFHWKPELVQATPGNLEDAKAFVRNIRDRGATDINDAVLQGTRMLKVSSRPGVASILVLLTDGDPTSGVTNLEVIQSNVREAIAGSFPLYCLGFGFDVNFDFLKKMSLQNSGSARRIYEDSDADLQLQGFYEEVATPLLTDVTMIYVGGANLTQTNFSQYYNGSEIVVAGEITNNDIETFSPGAVAFSRTKKIIFEKATPIKERPEAVSDVHIQRVWAFLTVKQLLDKELQASGPERETIKKKALELSLMYSFVTPLTSMVVTKPPGENADVLDKPKEDKESLHTQGYLAHSPPYPSGRFMLTRPRPKGAKVHTAPSRGSAFRPGLGSSPPSLKDLSYGNLLQVVQPPIVDQEDVFYYGADHADLDHSPPFILSTFIAPTDIPPTGVLISHRFLLKGQPVPICFDVDGNITLKLLHVPDRDLIVTGELGHFQSEGFLWVTIQLTADLDIRIGPGDITVHDHGQRSVYTQEEHNITVGSLTVTKHNREVDVVAGDVRIVILLHESHGKPFLWPVLKERPNNNENLEGILGLKPTSYEEVQQTPVTKVKINDREIDVIRSTATDHSAASSSPVDCWWMAADDALQRPLNHFTV
uniref:Inter-alpha-trypsin inhibitor heavy chain 3b, tandem duplicate 1 n=1 Tax=Cynoglossus semilaevis TaxID=244447 RepID=A0A3P8UJM3_CYNSE